MLLFEFITNLINISKLKKFFIFGICLFFLNCSNSYDYDNDKLESYFNINPSSIKELAIEKIQLEEIHLDSVPSSYLGNLTYRNDSLFFTDEKFCRLFIFNSKGHLIGNALGQGHGPTEIPSGQIISHVPLKNGNHLFVGVSYDGYLFDNKFNRLNQFRFNWEIKRSKNEIIKNPYPDHMDLYDINDEEKFKIRHYDDKVYFPIYSLCPTFDMFAKDYYKYGRIIGMMDINTGKLEKIMGRRSPEYLKYNFLVFDYNTFDISDKSYFYITYPPDSLIYKFNRDLELIDAFGCAGINMNTEYTEVKMPSDLRNLWQSEQLEKGYYSWIEYIDEHDLLFRSYTKGSHSETDGLQIYKKKILIGDLDVPKNFSVEAFIHPYYYSNVFIDEEKETMKVFRFKL